MVPQRQPPDQIAIDDDVVRGDGDGFEERAITILREILHFLFCGEKPTLLHDRMWP